MSTPKIDHRSLLPVNVNIVELSYEPHSSLRLRIGEFAPMLTPNTTSRVSDVIFAGVRGLEISLNLDSTNPCVTRVARWSDRSKDELVTSSTPITGISIETTMGSLKVACDSVQRTDLVKVPVVLGAHT